MKIEISNVEITKSLWTTNITNRYYSNRSEVLETKKDSLFKWIQSTKTPELAFPVTSPAFFNIDYSFELPEEAENTLNVKNAEELIVLTIAKIPNNNPRLTTVNLLAPIIFNVTNHKAGQVILSGTGFNVTHPLFNDSPAVEGGE